MNRKLGTRSSVGTQSLECEVTSVLNLDEIDHSWALFLPLKERYRSDSDFHYTELERASTCLISWHVMIVTNFWRFCHSVLVLSDIPGKI